MELPLDRFVRSLHSHLLICFLLLVGLAVGGCSARTARTRSASSLSAPDQEMLRQYETVRAFLARDDLRSARRAVQAYQKGKEAATPGSKTPVTDAVAKIAGANSLDPAREGFRAWSVYVIQLTRDVTGFYVIHCPLPGCGDWLQTDPKVDNPFMGKAMPDCGEVEK